MDVVDRIEEVVLLDATGAAVGTARKDRVHHAATPLHLAFSCYVFDADDRLLLSRRALDKTTFPGLWTNTVCGHPAPDEPIDAAVRRRVRHEIGLELDDLRLVLPGFAYDAEMQGVRENEMCPVFVATTTTVPAPEPTEVDDVAWVAWSTFRDEVLEGVRDVSPWCRLQVRDLAALGERPTDWRSGDPADLPPAARHSTS